MLRTLGTGPSIFCEKDENDWWGGIVAFQRRILRYKPQEISQGLR